MLGHLWVGVKPRVRQVARRGATECAWLREHEFLELVELAVSDAAGARA